MVQPSSLQLAILCAAVYIVVSQEPVAGSAKLELESLVYGEQWGAWKQQYGKSYRSEDEELERYDIWLDNLLYIENHNLNASQHGYSLRMNSLGDMVSAVITPCATLLVALSPVFPDFFRCHAKKAGRPNTVWKTACIATLKIMQELSYCKWNTWVPVHAAVP